MRKDKSEVERLARRANQWYTFYKWWAIIGVSIYLFAMLLSGFGN